MSLIFIYISLATTSCNTLCVLRFDKQEAWDAERDKEGSKASASREGGKEVQAERESTLR